MKLSCFNIKKILITPEMKPRTLISELEKNKKDSTPKKNSYISGNGTFYL